MTFTLLHRAGLRRWVPPVDHHELGTEAGEHLRHVAHQVVGHFGLLNHDCANRRMPQRRQQLGATSVEPRADLNHDCCRWQRPLCGLYGEPRHLPVQVSPLVPRGHSGIDGYSRHQPPFCLAHSDSFMPPIMMRGCDSHGRTRPKHHSGQQLPTPLKHAEALRCCDLGGVGEAVQAIGVEFETSTEGPSRSRNDLVGWRA